jgi:hypothetical protein
MNGGVVSSPLWGLILCSNHNTCRVIPHFFDPILGPIGSKRTLQGLQSTDNCHTRNFLCIPFALSKYP